MKEQKFIKKGRTGREGVTLKSYGGLAGVVGLIWALMAFVMAEGYGALTAPICILAMGGLMFWVGHTLARNAARVRA